MNKNRHLLIGGVLLVLIILTGLATSVVPENAPIAANDFAELTKTVVKEGTGDRLLKANDKVKVHYVGTLKNGTKFDSSRDRNQPFELTVGVGEVIPGWDQGLLGMKKGELRRLEIPSKLAYGNQDQSSIPANSGLIFEVELLSFEN